MERDLKNGDVLDDRETRNPNETEAKVEEKEEAEVYEELDELEAKERIKKAESAKLEGNALFQNQKYEEAASCYSEAIDISPCLASNKTQRAIYLCNRAACELALGRYSDVVKDCTESLKHNSEYIKALMRRAQAYEALDQTVEAECDILQVLQLDSGNQLAKQSAPRLRNKVLVKQEREKEEMISNLKDLGNKFLGKFGLSTDNFKAEQDPSTGSYNIKFQQ